MHPQAIAEKYLVLQAVVGSRGYGIAIDGQEDTDLLGVCTQPPETMYGLQVYGPYRFDGYEYRSRPEGVWRIWARPCRLHHPRLVRGTVPLWVSSSVLECRALSAGWSGACDQFFPAHFGLRPHSLGSASRKSSPNGFP